MADWDERDLRADEEASEEAYPDPQEELDFVRPADSGHLAWAIWAAAALVVVTAAIVVYQRLGSNDPAQEPAPEPVAAVSEPAPDPGPDVAEPEPEEPPLPSLNESDGLVRELLEALSAHPALAALFVDEGLVRRAVVIVVNVAEGDDPTRHVRHLVPEEKFRVVRRGAHLYVDRESYRRYDGLADGFAGLDPEGTAALYRRLKPLVDEAYRELGYLDQPFESVLASAMRKLAAVPVIEGSIAVYPVSVNYQYEDERLARLEPAQKLLLRMGPENVRKIQTKLRELAEAFGIAF